MLRGHMRSVFPALVAVLIALSGCGGGVEEKTITAEEPPELVNANKSMEEFMKTSGKKNK